jgi:hypothetical protein
MPYCEVVDRPKNSSASELIERAGQEYWWRLQEKLAIGVEFLPDGELSGSITTFEGGLRVTITRIGAFNQTHTDIFYKRNATEIRCSTHDSGLYTLRFCVTPDNQVAVTSARGVDHMNPDQASEFIMQSMFDAMNRK